MTNDRILAVLALLAVIAFYLPLVLWVPAPALIAVLAAVTAMMVYDFWVELRPREKD